MALVLEKYVREPLDEIYFALDSGEPLPILTLADRTSTVQVNVGNATWTIPREGRVYADDSAAEEFPPDAGDFLPGLE
jgi:hypothetical protein